MEQIEIQKLTENELLQVRRLADLCNEKDGIHLKLNWSTLQSRNTQETNDILVYDDGELIAFLGIYSFISSEAEISGMVHPNYRRQGIYSNLVKAAMQECRRRSIAKLIFICQRGSSSGKAFLEAMEVPYFYSEYSMEMDCEGPPSPMVAQSEVIQLRQSTATVDDIEILTHLNQQGFQMKAEEAKDYVERTIVSKKEITYIAELGDTPIGKSHATTLEKESGFIYGFCILPSYRGRGYGRQILAQTIELLLTNSSLKRIQLEVTVDNALALGLYESCGFKMMNANDYYTIE